MNEKLFFLSKALGEYRASEAEQDALLEAAGDFAKFAVTCFKAPLARKALAVSLAIAAFVDESQKK